MRLRCENSWSPDWGEKQVKSLYAVRGIEPRSRDEAETARLLGMSVIDPESTKREREEAFRQ